MKKIIRTILSMGILWFIGSSCANFTPAQIKEPDMRIMTFNIFRSGTGRGQPLSQTAKVIQQAEADIVGLQEAGRSTKALAQLLGWNHVSNGWSSILTRYEILERYKGGIKVKLDSGKEAYIFNLHLKPAPYQPYQLLNIPYHKAPFIKTEQQAIASAKEARGQQVATFLEQIKALPNKELPIFVTGDYNEPSHLDWTEAAAKSGRHPIKVKYPSSLAITNAGFIDAWRALYPDEIKKPGFTWTPLTKADDPKDHHDRIDLVYFRGKDIKLNEVKIVGKTTKMPTSSFLPTPLITVQLLPHSQYRNSRTQKRTILKNRIQTTENSKHCKNTRRLPVFICSAFFRRCRSTPLGLRQGNRSCRLPYQFDREKESLGSLRHCTSPSVLHFVQPP